MPPGSCDRRSGGAARRKSSRPPLREAPCSQLKTRHPASHRSANPLSAAAAGPAAMPGLAVWRALYHARGRFPASADHLPHAGRAAPLHRCRARVIRLRGGGPAPPERHQDARLAARYLASASVRTTNAPLLSRPSWMAPITALIWLSAVLRRRRRSTTPAGANPSRRIKAPKSRSHVTMIAPSAAADSRIAWSASFQGARRNACPLSSNAWPSLGLTL